MENLIVQKLSAKKTPGSCPNSRFHFYTLINMWQKEIVKITVRKMNQSNNFPGAER